MTEKWFVQYIENALSRRGRVVILDPNASLRFLLPHVKSIPATVIATDSKLTKQWQVMMDELLRRHEVETNHRAEPVVFYTTRSLAQMSFLYDYCFTYGLLDLTRPSDWIRQKIYEATGLQVQFDDSSILTAAKLGVGKDITWWKKIIQNLHQMVDLDEELLPFLENPDDFLSSKDDDVRTLFEARFFELLKQPIQVKPPQTIAREIVKRMFDGLVYNEITEELLNLYRRWTDSSSSRSALMKYISEYKVTDDSNPWQSHPEHCLEKLDERCLLQIAENLRDEEWVKERLAVLRKRLQSSKKNDLIPSWLEDVVVLLEYESTTLFSCDSLNSVVEYYTHYFSRVDRSIRRLYEKFLNDESIIRPLQERYESILHELLERWYAVSGMYVQDQQGYLRAFFESAKPRVAVVVGDGLRYEIANHVATVLKGQCKVELQIMLGDLPSETERGMSALYVGNNAVLSTKSEREKRLASDCRKDITFLDLESVQYGMTADYLVCTYGDIDYASEKLQQGAIKLFSTFETILIEKIGLLLSMGYREVQLVSDHGFVLTGLLDESDKIEAKPSGVAEVKERYFRTVDKQEASNFLEFESVHKDFRYLYVAKSHRPFKSSGAYGYSHGGFTPQEVILPKFSFTKHKSQVTALNVQIVNKQELGEATGELFVVKLQAAKSSSDLFAAKRAVQVLLFAGDRKYSSSNIITIEPEQTLAIEFSFESNKTVEAILIDAENKEQLDIVVVKQSQMRDIGL